MKNASLMRLFFIVFTFLLLLFPCYSQSSPDLPQDNLSYPVLLVGKDGATGSGFFYNKDNAIYLITARHVLFKETFISVPKEFVIPSTLRHKFDTKEDKTNKALILSFHGVMSNREKAELLNAAPKVYRFNFNKSIEQLYRESQKLKLRSDEIELYSYVPQNLSDLRATEIKLKLAKLYESGYLKYHPSHDVALIKVGIPEAVADHGRIKFIDGITMIRGEAVIGLGKENFKLLKDVIVGNQVFVFGYPTSITEINPWLNIKLPLLRKGTIAGKNEDLKTIILDCPSYGGNSGGLVIEIDRTSLTEIKFQAIGLITNFVPYQKGWFQNTGYSIVVPMDFVEELVESKTK